MYRKITWDKISTVNPLTPVELITQCLQDIADSSKNFDMTQTLKDNFDDVLAEAISVSKETLHFQEPFRKTITMIKEWESEVSHQRFSLYRIHQYQYTGATLFFGTLMPDPSGR